MILEPGFRRRQRLPEFSRNFGCGVWARHAADAEIGELVTDSRTGGFRAIGGIHFVRCGFGFVGELAIVLNKFCGGREETFRREVEIIVFNVDIGPRTPIDEQAQNPQLINRLQC